MTNRPLGGAIRYIRTLTDSQSAADGQLLDRFTRLRDEAAFAAILRRHGPMVLAVCQRSLGQYQEAEDAFQATFLMLARKASSIRKQESLGSWLHGVARRLALKAKGRDDRRRVRERRAGEMRKTVTDVEAAWAELREALDESLQCLPERYRSALVICHLEGRTHEEAARQLGCPVATLRSRLTRGRKLLRTELTRRGITLTAGALGAALLMSSAEAAPALLLDATLKGALLFAAGKTAAGAVPASAAALANEGVKALGMMKTKIVVILLAALSLVGVGVGALAQSAAKPPEVKSPETKVAAAPHTQGDTQARLDDYGDPLPENAVRRVGTLRFRPGGGQFTSLLVTPDGKTLVSGGFHGDQSICAWDLATGKLLHSFPGSWWDVRFALSPDGTTLAAPLGRDAIGFWDLATGRLSRRLEWNSDLLLQGFAFSPDGKTLAVGDEAGFIDFWNLNTGKIVERRKTANSRVTLLAFTPDGKTLFTGDFAEDAIIQWDTASGKEIRRLTQANSVETIALSPGGAFLASIGDNKGNNKSVRLWELSTGKPAYVEVPAGQYADWVAFSPDGKTLLSSEWNDQEATLVLRDVKSGKIRRSYKIPSLVCCVAYSPDGKTLIGGYGYGRSVIGLWDAETGKERDPPSGKPFIRNAALSPDGRTLAYEDKDIRFWDMAAGRDAGALPAEPYQYSGNFLAFAPDGKSLLSVDANALLFWDMGTRKLSHRIDRGGKKSLSGFETAAFAPDGKTLASVEGDGSVRLKDAASGKELRQFVFNKGEEEKKRGARPGALAFSPDSRTLAASGGASGVAASRVRLWDAVEPTPVAPLLWEIEIPSDGTKGVSGTKWARFVWPRIVFSPDGRMLAMNRYQKTIPVWDAASGKERMLLTGHEESTACVAFTPDGRTLASASWDDTIRLWDIETGAELRLLRGHRGKANFLAFSADGNTLVSTGDDTTMLFWDVDAVTHRRRPKATPLSADECEALWADLASADAAKAYRAIRAFGTAPAQTPAFLGKRLRPAGSADKADVERWIAALDSDDFEEREKATRELEDVGEAAKPALRKVMDGQPSPEVRSRLSRLLEKVATPSAELLRGLRAVEALEAVGDQEARTVLARMATGAAESRLTREANTSLKRLGEGE